MKFIGHIIDKLMDNKVDKSIDIYNIKPIESIESLTKDDYDEIFKNDDI